MKKIINIWIIFILSFILIWCWNETNIEQNNQDIISEDTIKENVIEPEVEEIDALEVEVIQIESLEDEILTIDWRQEIIDLQLEFGRAHVSTLDCNNYIDDWKKYCESEQDAVK